MPVLFLEYPKCSTCKKAKKWLNEHGVDYIDRDIVGDNPTAAELAEWRERGGPACAQALQYEPVCSIVSAT